ncbi:hypothetical protein NQZ68_036772, partial [Dissostichus eleginoides]
MAMPSHGGLLGVDVSGVGMGIRMSNSGTGNGSAYPSGALPASAITSLGQPCACQQCMLVLSVKAGAMSAHTLGRRPPQTKPPSPKMSYPVQGGSYSLTLPRPPSLSRSFSPHRTSIIGATGGYTLGGMGGAGGVGTVGGGGYGSASFGYGGGFTHSLSLLGSATAALSLHSTRPPSSTSPPSSSSSSPALHHTLIFCHLNPSPFHLVLLLYFELRPYSALPRSTSHLHGRLHLHALAFGPRPGPGVFIWCRCLRGPPAPPVQPRRAEPTCTAANRHGSVTCPYRLW